MFQLLMHPRPTRSPLRRLAGLFATATTPAPVVAPADIAPVGLFEANEVPALADIEAAAAAFNLATQQARSADRGKRAARKILDRLPVGRYGAWVVSRKANGRQTADLDAIRATYARLGLGPVPMKSSAPSLVVERTEALVEVTA